LEVRILSSATLLSGFSSGFFCAMEFSAYSLKVFRI
jgi:hypothetical protein